MKLLRDAIIASVLLIVGCQAVHEGAVLENDAAAERAYDSE